MIDWIHAEELKWIISIHSLRTPLLDGFFRALDFLDREEFFFLLIPILWVACSWKVGSRVLLIAIVTKLVNGILKEWFASIRPFHLVPALKMLHVSGYSFPSGSAQTAMILSLYMAYSMKSRWKWGIIIPYFFLLSFSRVYLGVHFPTDILGGWCVALFLWFGYRYLSRIREGIYQSIK